MRYFFISDLHGCEPGLVDIALKAKGFDRDRDTLVVLGDIVDRGRFTRQLLDYLLNMPHLIAVRGNHDVRVLELLKGEDYPQSYDKHNGVGATFASFLGWEPSACNEDKLYITSNLIEEGNNPTLKHTLPRFFYYMRKAVWGIEFPDLIGVHGWLPIDRYGHLVPVEAATKLQWVDAVWADTEAQIRLQRFPDKKLIIGHWHAWRLRVVFGMNMKVNAYLDQVTDLSAIDFSPYETANYIAIDSCTSISDQVNVYVYESDAEPEVYADGRRLSLSDWCREVK